MRKSGFTLVELSIVLVIIGLLIGGILVAQSLIDSSKVNKTVSQIQQFNAGVASFVSKFRDLPGDMKFDSSATLGLGDGDGIISGCVGRPTRTFDHCGEVANFWPMMQVSGFRIEGVPDNIPVATTFTAARYVIVASGVGQNVPKAAVGDNVGIAAYSVGINTAAGGLPFNSGTIQAGENVPASNYYFLANFQNMIDNNSIAWSYDGNATRNWDAGIPVTQAASIDNKMDDGSMNTGDVLNGSRAGDGCSITTTNYDIAGGLDCVLMIKMPKF